VNTGEFQDSSHARNTINGYEVSPNAHDLIDITYLQMKVTYTEHGIAKFTQNRPPRNSPETDLKKSPVSAEDLISLMKQPLSQNPLNRDLKVLETGRNPCIRSRL